VALTDALTDALKRRPGVEVMPGKDYVEMRLLFGCTEEGQLGPCMAQAGKSLVADKLVLATMHGDTAAAKSSGRVEVQLKLLDVSASRVVRQVIELVPPASLAGAALAATAGRWLDQLLGAAIPASAAATSTTPRMVAEPAAVAPPTSTPVESPGPGRGRGRGLVVAGVVALGLAAAAGGAAVYTWRHYVGLEPTTTATLVRVRDGALDYYYAGTHRSWFASPDCTFPDARPPGHAASTYVDQCNEGSTHATVTTALVVGAGVLAAGGATLLALGVRAGRAETPPRAMRETPSRAGTRPRAAELRLAPSLSPAGAGLAVVGAF